MGTAPKEIGLSVVSVPNDKVFGCVVIPPPKVKVDELLWDKTDVVGVTKAVVAGAPKDVAAFGSEPKEGVGLLNDEFALPNDGACCVWNAVDGLPKATEATDWNAGVGTVPSNC